MANIRECRQCGKMVDFDEPWCDHETMEESAILDMKWRAQRARLREAFVDPELSKKLQTNSVFDKILERVATELGYSAGKHISEVMKKLEE